MLLDRSLGTTSPAEFGIWHVPIGTFWAIVIGLGDGNPRGSPSDMLMSNLSMKTHAKNHCYLSICMTFIGYLGPSPDPATVEDHYRTPAWIGGWTQQLKLQTGVCTVAAPTPCTPCSNRLSTGSFFLMDVTYITVTYLNICIMKKIKGSLCCFCSWKISNLKSLAALWVAVRESSAEAISKQTPVRARGISRSDTWMFCKHFSFACSLPTPCCAADRAYQAVRSGNTNSLASEIDGWYWILGSFPPTTSLVSIPWQTLQLWALKLPN